MASQGGIKQELGRRAVSKLMFIKPSEHGCVGLVLVEGFWGTLYWTEDVQWLWVQKASGSVEDWGERSLF